MKNLNQDLESLQEVQKEKISYSELKTYQECPHKHKLQYIDQVAKFEGNEYTAFGTSMHYVCENIVEQQDLSTTQLQNIFVGKLVEEIKSLKDKSIELNSKMLIEMKDQGKSMVDDILPAVREYFGNFSVISIEESIYENMSLVDLAKTNFKGFIDLVIQTEDGKYHVIDWKTCSWGWDMKKRSDSLTTYQLTYYKTFFSQKHNIPMENIETHFALLKRTAKKNKVEIFRVTSGQRKVNNSLKLLEKTVKSINKGVTFKNRLSCKYCNFYKTAHCT